VEHVGFDRLRFKIEELRRYIEVLELYRYTDLGDLENDPDLRNSAENSMQVAADCTLDIAEMILSEQGIEEKADYMERICALSDIEVLDDEFAQRLALTADYWDVLLRHRTKVDVCETHNHIQNIADDLREFLDHVSEYAESDVSGHASEYEENEDQDIDIIEGDNPDINEEEIIEEEIIEDIPIEEESVADEADLLDEHEEETIK
jgi:uncharacterized protein YutE (UPF0331/DUF86 family)